MASIVFKVKVAWWVRYYIAGVAFVANLMHCEPDWHKVTMTVRKGLSLGRV